MNEMREVNVVQVDGTEMCVQLQVNSSVLEVKQALEREHGLDARGFELYCTVRELELQDTDTIHDSLSRDADEQGGGSAVQLFMVNGGQESVDKHFMLSNFGFPAEHLELLSEFYSKEACANSEFKWLKPDEATWSSAIEI